MGFRTDGNISPPPVMNVRKITIDGCAMAVAEVHPSDNPPIKYDGRVCVRIGPRRGYASAEEERRLTEKRVWQALPFDQQPIIGATDKDIDSLRFCEEFLPATVDPDILIENGRSIPQQMQTLRVITRDGRPTAMGILVCGKDPRAWIPGAYVQFVRYQGTDMNHEILDQKEISGPLSELLRFLDDIISTNIMQRSNLGGTTEHVSLTYPAIAVQELVRNAIIHRRYDGTSAPVTFSWYADRIEITSPGGTYGTITPETFGQTGLTEARNPALAAAAKDMGYVQRFGSGIPRARAALLRNGNPTPDFQVEPNFVHVTIKAAP